MSKPGNRIIISIELGNDAMQTYADVATALQEQAVDLMRADSVVRHAPVPGHRQTLRDANGNRVGSWHVE